MLQQKNLKYCWVGTDKTYTIKEFAKKAFEVLDLDYKKYVKINKVF